MITTRNVGKGRVVYVAANLGKNYTENHTWPYVRKLITNSIRYAAQDKMPLVKIKNAPLHLQMTVFEQKEKQRKVVHLLNQICPIGFPPYLTADFDEPTPLFTRIREDLVPLYGIIVKIEGRYKKVYTVPGEELEMNFEDGYTTVSVPRVDTHIMVVAEL
jgi:hypothetical protein